MECEERNEHINVEKTEFIPREYQVEIVEKAIDNNAIVFLPTGSGKTFIAIMVIKHYMHELKLKYSMGGKRIFFLVNNTPLVHQQAEAIRQLLPLEVGEYTGDLNVDMWNSATWLDHQDKYQVLVMTAQIYLNMLLHAFTMAEQASVLIFDECHQAVNKHPMRQIMMLIEQDNLVHKPRILGLTAALINKNVKPHKVSDEIITLEKTFHSTVIRALNYKMALQYAANPNEEILLYQVSEEREDFYNVFESNIVELELNLSAIELPELKESIEDCFDDMSSLMLLNDLSCKPLKRVRLGLKDALLIAEELGLYGADIAVLSLIVLIERFKIVAEGKVYNILCAIATKLHYMRKVFTYYMPESPISKKVLAFATDKVLKLKELLKKVTHENQVLIFVERRSTAHCLFHMFNQLSLYDDTFRNIKADFIIGTNQQMNNLTRENLLNRRRNKLIMKRFNMGNINVLFASNVIEEGIDIRKCNLVVKFDMPVTFRSYVQSKGRARHKMSRYIIMSPNVAVGFEKFQQFKDIETALTHVLCTKKKSEESSSIVDGDEFFTFVCPSGSRFTALQAISLLNRYCSLLPHDKFSPLTILWWVEKVQIQNENKYIGYVQLPINSAIKEKIKGIARDTITSAKRLAAFEACKRLYAAGEFDSHLVPYGIKTDVLNDINLFPLWNNAYFDNKLSKDMKRKKQYFDKHYSHWECNSRPLPGREVFLHMIKVTPDYSYPDSSRLQAFYNLLLHESTFCIVSLHSWPELPSFPLFMNVGKVKIDMLCNNSFIALSEEEISNLVNFQKVIFLDAMALLKSYHKYNVDQQTDDYLIAPVVKINGSYMIDWNTVKSQHSFPEIEPKPFEKRLTDPVTEERYETKIVIPWYRQETFNLKYVVTKVRTDENPNSQFPSQNYKSYRHYFLHRYNQKIFDMTQPMLEVRAISSKINCLKPRGQYNSKRQKKEEEGFEETLVPELCYLVNFPAWYLVKATLLPSALHRVHYLLVAEELRQKIVVETNMGSLAPPPDMKWKELCVKREAGLQAEADETFIPELCETKKLFISNIDMEDFIPLDPGEELPMDISRKLDIDLAGVVQSSNFFNKTVDSNFYQKIVESLEKPKARTMKAVAPLKLIEGSYPGYGPEPVDILEALTAARSGDIINYERAELLGDCFLKLAASLCLFTFYPDFNEGTLSQIKGKIIGNMNLFFCGLAINIPGLLKVNSFDYKDWKVPGFSLPPSLLPHLHDPEMDVSILDQLSHFHMKYGKLSNEHLAEIESNLGLGSGAIDLKCEENDDNEEDLSDASSDEDAVSIKVSSIASKDEYLMKHFVQEKIVSDSVEALISVYLENFGIEGGFKILNWLKIIPECMCDINKILHSPPASPQRNSSDFFHLLPEIEDLENNLGYTFKNRAFALQALTHSSYNHSITDCYQRFEFLGDAILDFLLTSYIYGEFKDMTPGCLTDLRSALVNNITFACLAVKYNFHKHMLFKACKLSDIISRFVKFQETRNHKFGPEIFYLIEEKDVQVAECVDVPKALGDVFESLVAAVYLDCGKDLNCVWHVVYNLMENELKTFSMDIPKNPLRTLYETFTENRPKFGNAEVRGDLVMIPLEVVHDGINKVFHGIGENKYFAKTAASKLALKYFEME